MKKEKFTSSLDCQLSTYTSIIQNPKADVFFVHGLGEHAQRYFNEAKHLNSKGLNFYAYDQRTHGESEGKYRTYIHNFENYIQEYSEFLKFYKAGQERPFFLMSHSMGGLVQLSYLLSRGEESPQFKGAAFSSPFLMPKKDMAPILQMLSPIIARFFPRLKTVSIDKKNISRDPKEQESYINDPLNYKGGVYAKTADNLLKQTKKIVPLFENMKYSYIIQHGTDDQLAEIEGSKTLFKVSQSSDKSFIPLEEFRHEITRELDHEKVMINFSDWMMARL